MITTQSHQHCHLIDADVYTCYCMSYYCRCPFRNAAVHVSLTLDVVFNSCMYGHCFLLTWHLITEAMIQTASV